MSMTTCTLTGIVYGIDMVVKPHVRFVVKKVITPSYIVYHGSDTFWSDESGYVSIPLPQSSTAYLYALVCNLDQYEEGTKVVVPASATADLVSVIQQSQT